MARICVSVSLDVVHGGPGPWLWWPRSGGLVAQVHGLWWPGSVVAQGCVLVVPLRWPRSVSLCSSRLVPGDLDLSLGGPRLGSSCHQLWALVALIHVVVAQMCVSVAQSCVFMSLSVVSGGPEPGLSGPNCGLWWPRSVSWGS